MLQPWKELKRQLEFKKYSRTIERRDYELPSGEITDYYITVSKPGACVLAITADNKIITARQYRPGPNAILRELPGGVVDDGEDPKVAAMRELQEETGFTGEALWVGQWYEDATTERTRYIVVATNCKMVTSQQLEDTEFIEIDLVSIPEFVAQVRKGELTDTAGAMLGLDYLGLLDK